MQKQKVLMYQQAHKMLALKMTGVLTFHFTIYNLQKSYNEY